MEIRKETIKDQEAIYQVVEEAFKTAEHADGDEQNLVNRLRSSKAIVQSFL